MAASDLVMRAMMEPDQYPVAAQEEGQELLEEQAALYESGEVEAACRGLRSYLEKYRTAGSGS